MRAAGFLRVAAADDGAVSSDDDAAHARVRIGKADRVLRERERFAHERFCSGCLEFAHAGSVEFKVDAEPWQGWRQAC